jgi:hypothetical protein
VERAVMGELVREQRLQLGVGPAQGARGDEQRAQPARGGIELARLLDPQVEPRRVDA